MIAVLFLTSLLPNIYAGTLQGDQSDEGYIIDQTQTDEGGYYYPVTYGNPAAQSFVPSMTPLAKVRLYVKSYCPVNPCESYSLKVSIRDDLDKDDLTSVIINKDMIPDYYSWVNFDFEDITVEPGKTYYMVVTSLYPESEYRWAMWSSQDIEKYEPGEAWAQIVVNQIIKWTNFSGCSDFCFKTYGYAGRVSDLSCQGIIGLPDQVPGGTATASFTIKNIGDENSLLNWEISSYPEWGNWIFDPMEGTDLEPKDGTITVTVTIEVPNEKNADFSGEIVVVNKDNESDTETISVSLSTPKNKDIQRDLLNWFLINLKKLLQIFPIFLLEL